MVTVSLKQIKLKFDKIYISLMRGLSRVYILIA